MNRRDFIFALGAVSLGIAGWVLCPTSHVETAPTDAATSPKLREGIVHRVRDDGGELLRVDNGRSEVVARLNHDGMRVVTQLDGTKSIEEIAHSLLAAGATDHAKAVEASVAAFVAVLAEAQMLSSPYYVNICRAEVLRDA